MQNLRLLFVLGSLLAVATPATAPGFTLTQPTVQFGRDHDPKQLERAGVVSWDTLRELDVVYETKGPGMTDFRTSFTSALLELDGKTVKLIGFIYPTEAGEDHRRFLLAAYPPSCPFCLPGGATEMVEVLASTPVRFTYEAIVLEGRFELLRDDPSGLLYRLHDARPVVLN
ncbi:MAG: hypothetical protein KatS3mg117_0581 [Geminicoccaceae bacterium]|jgi:hypothetical protein|nr:MAG: hypothetical protein KatS3mg117_0581 [Geminicoccaceae bacterium]